jgi:flagellar hook-length control protein FliK
MEAARFNSGHGELTLQLQPAHLGSLKITVSSAADGVSARIVADSRQAQHALEASKDHLQTAFTSRGMKLNSLDISLGGDAGTNGRPAYSGSAGASDRQVLAQPAPAAGQETSAIGDAPAEEASATQQSMLGRVDYRA